MMENYSSLFRKGFDKVLENGFKIKIKFYHGKKRKKIGEDPRAKKNKKKLIDRIKFWKT